MNKIDVVERIAQLKAAQALYKALCRKYQITAYPQLVTEIAARCEDGKVLEKLVLSSPEVGPQHAQACLDLIGAYCGTRNVCFWGCSIGDDGLVAIANHLRACVDKWFRGSKLLAVELTSDGSNYLGSSWCDSLCLYLIEQQTDNESNLAATSVRSP